MVRRLQHRQLRIFDKPADGHLQESARRHVVAVENRDKFAAAARFQRMVDIARLGVLVRRTHYVIHADAGGEFAKLFAAAVVEQIDIEPIFRPVDAHRRIDGRLHHAERFVVGRHQQIDARPLIERGRHRDRLTVKRPQRLKIAQHQHYPGVGFRHNQQ